MARPARPASERAAVVAAARLVRTERPGSDPAVAAEIARRVVEAFAADWRRAAGDALDAALANVGRVFIGRPILDLATDPEADVHRLFEERRVERFRARDARALAPDADAREITAVLNEIEAVLAGRYLRHLREAEIKPRDQ